MAAVPALTQPRSGAQLNRPHPLAQSLSGCWICSEGTGTRLHDLTGHARHGTLPGGTSNPAWAASDFGRCLDLDGFDDYVTFGAASGDFTSEDFTIAFWVKPDNVNTTAINGSDEQSVLVFKGEFQVGGYYLQMAHTANGDLAFVTNQTGANQITRTNSGLMTAGEWQHVVVRRAGSSVRIFRNGLEATYAATGTHVSPAATADAFQFGRYAAFAGAFHFNGKFSELALYRHRALSVADIRALAAQPYLLLEQPGRRYWSVQTTVTLTPAPAAATWTVNAVTLTTPVTFALAPVSAAWVANAPVLSTEVVLTPATAAATWSVGAGTTFSAVQQRLGAALRLWWRR